MLASVSAVRNPLRLARIAGTFYLGTILAGLFSELVRYRVVVSGNAPATAHNMLVLEGFYRWAFASDLFAGACYLVVTLLLYLLLKPVSGGISLLAAFFSIIGVAVGAIGALANLAALSLVEGTGYLGAFDAAQLQATAYLFVKLHAQGNLTSLVFFGCYCLLIGWLVFESSFFPRAIGVLMALAGACYLINSLANFVSPPIAARLFPLILLPCLVGELALTLWLLVAGINVPRWEERANRPTA